MMRMLISTLFYTLLVTIFLSLKPFSALGAIKLTQIESKRSVLFRFNDDYEEDEVLTEDGGTWKRILAGRITQIRFNPNSYRYSGEHPTRVEWTIVDSPTTYVTFATKDRFHVFCDGQLYSFPKPPGHVFRSSFGLFPDKSFYFASIQTESAARSVLVRASDRKAILVNGAFTSAGIRGHSGGLIFWGRDIIFDLSHFDEAWERQDSSMRWSLNEQNSNYPIVARLKKSNFVVVRYNDDLIGILNTRPSEGEPAFVEAIPIPVGEKIRVREESNIVSVESVTTGHKFVFQKPTFKPQSIGSRWPSLRSETTCKQIMGRLTE